MAAVQWLKGMLDRVDAAATQPPSESQRAEIVNIPHGVDRLRKAIESVQRQVLDKDLQLAEYNRAWEAARQEYDAACCKNRLEHENACVRLEKLQIEWIEITKRLGIYAALPGAELPDAPPLPMREPDVTDAEWTDPEQ